MNSTYTCQNCGKENPKKGRSYRHKYCNNKCQHEAQYKVAIEKWKGGDRIGKGPLKKYLGEQKAGCWQCGITEWQGEPIVLDLEHIDGNADNNSEENLSLLCPNCHSQTPTYKNRNHGNGRHTRRQRYAAKKSY